MVTQNFLQGVWHELRELWRGSNDPISTWGIWLYLLLVALADPSVVFFVIAAAQAENVVVPLGWSSGMEFSSTSCLPLASSYLSTSASTKAQNVQNVRDTCPAVAVAISSLRGFGRTEFSESEKPGTHTSSIQKKNSSDLHSLRRFLFFTGLESPSLAPLLEHPPQRWPRKSEWSQPALVTATFFRQPCDWNQLTPVWHWDRQTILF